MRLPSTLKIAGRRWHVESLANPEGICAGEPRIFVRTRQRSESAVVDTLIHEMLHAAFPAGVVDDRTEERLVAKLAAGVAPAVHQLLKEARRCKSTRKASK